MKEEGSKKACVVDASAWLAWLLPDEVVPESLTSYFERFGNEEIVFIAPNLLKYEFANALRSNFLRKRLSKAATFRILRNLLELPIKFVDIEFSDSLEISLKENVSFYDASYIYLSRRYKIELISLDKKLSKLI